jgi:Tol biopolymer transport system component
LYVHSASGNDEKQLTKDTGDTLFNGDIDWVYAEELAVRSNYFWSPDSKDIVFMHMDETNVPTYPITDWMPTHPTVDQEKYPKVGDPNPVVKLGVVDADKGKVKWITLTSDEDFYIPRFGWVKDGVIWAEVLNRAQTKMDLYFVDTKTGKPRLVLTETQEGAWFDFEHTEIRFLKSGGQFLWPSWRDGNMHMYLYSFDKQNPMAADAKLNASWRRATTKSRALRALMSVRVRGTARRIKMIRGSRRFSRCSLTDPASKPCLQTRGFTLRVSAMTASATHRRISARRPRPFCRCAQSEVAATRSGKRTMKSQSTG